MGETTTMRHRTFVIITILTIFSRNNRELKAGFFCSAGDLLKRTHKEAEPTLSSCSKVEDCRLDAIIGITAGNVAIPLPNRKTFRRLDLTDY
jgi:hypothetical protein